MPEGQQPEIVPTKITVTEGKPRKVNFGVGYGSEERARASIDWRHVNFFGGARTMQFIGQASRLDRGVRLNFKQPAVFGPRYGLQVERSAVAQRRAGLHARHATAAVSRSSGCSPAAGRTRSALPTTTLFLKYTNQYERYTVSEEAQNDPTFRDDLIALGLNPETGEGQGWLSSLTFDVSRGTGGTNQTSPRSGYVVNAHVEQAGQVFGGDFNYREVVLEGRGYLALGRRALFATRLRGGSIDGFGNQDANVPFFKRYFLGGASSLRGWGRFEVSPLTAEGNPIGGATLLDGSVELRMPIWHDFSGVAFVDVGNVWTNPWTFQLQELRYDIGPGIRYNTPVGALRVDVGFQLNPIPGLLVNGEPEPRHFRVHFSIGQSF